MSPRRLLSLKSAGQRFSTQFNACVDLAFTAAMCLPVPMKPSKSDPVVGIVQTVDA